MEEGTHSQRKSWTMLDTWKMVPFLILPQTSHLALHKAFLSPDRAVQRLSCGWWCLGLHSSWFHVNVTSQGGSRAWPLAFQVCLCAKLQVFLPQCVLCFAFTVGVLITRTAVLYPTQELELWTGWRHLLVNIPAVPVMCVIHVPWGPQNHGLPCHRWGDVSSGAMLTRGCRSLPVPGESAPVCCKSAESGRYWRSLKYLWCPPE